MTSYRILRDDGISDGIAGQMFVSYDAAHAVLERYYADLCCSDEREYYRIVAAAEERTDPAELGAMDEPATAIHLSPDERRRIRDALRYLARDLHHRSFAVSAERRDLLWQEMDRCLELADRLADESPVVGDELP